MTARAPYDVVVVGLGLAGLVAGLAAASRGASVLLTGKGYGTLRFRAGTIDVLGYREGHLVQSPARELPLLTGAQPPHPYALAAADLPDGLAAVRAAATTAGIDLRGDLAANQLIATAAGTLRPTCLAPSRWAPTGTGPRWWSWASRATVTSRRSSWPRPSRRPPHVRAWS